MASHMQPPRSKTRPFAILAVAVAVGLFVVVVFDRDGDDDALVRDTPERSTAPTVLGEVTERATTLPAAPPAIPATFAVGSEPVAGEEDPPGPTVTQPPDTTSPTLIPPTSITSPNPPRTTTTTSTTQPTTTEATTTTEPTTTSTPG